MQRSNINIKALMLKASKSFIEGRDNESILRNNSQLNHKYKYSRFSYLTVKDEPFLGDRVRIPGTRFIASAGPQDENEVMMLLSDTIFDEKKNKIMSLVSDYLSSPENKKSVMKKIITSISSLPNISKVVAVLENYATSPDMQKVKDRIMETISSLIGDQLLSRPIVRYIVALGDHMAVDPDVHKDFYEYFSTDRIFDIKNENNNVSIKVNNIHGHVHVEKHVKTLTGSIEEKNINEDQAEKYINSPVYSLIHPLSSVVHSELSIQDKSNKHLDPKKIEVTLFNLHDNDAINLEIDNFVENKKYPLIGNDQNEINNKKQEILDSTKEAIWRIFEIYQNEPILVHCKAGVGRTGHFILMMEILKHYDSIFANDDLDTSLDKINSIIENMRQVRPALISTKFQLTQAIYNAHIIHEYALEKNYLNKIKIEDNASPVFLAKIFEDIPENKPTVIPFDKRPKLVNTYLHANLEYFDALEIFVEECTLDTREKKSEIQGELLTLYKNLSDAFLIQCDWDILSSKDTENLKLTIAEINKKILAMTPFKTDKKNIIEVDDNELNFLIHDRREFNHRYNLAIKQTAAYMSCSYAGNSIIEALSETMKMLAAETNESITTEKYHQFLHFLISNECFYLVDYFLSKDIHAKETIEWLKLNGLDPYKETKHRKYTQLDNYNKKIIISHFFNAEKPTDGAMYLIGKDFEDYLTSQGCSHEKIQQFKILAAMLDKPEGKTFYNVLTPKFGNRELYKLVITHKLDLLLEHFPYHTKEEAAQISKEAMNETQQIAKSEQDIIKNKIITIDSLPTQVKIDLMELNNALSLNWSLENIFNSITTSKGFGYDAIMECGLYSLLDYLPKSEDTYLPSPSPLETPFNEFGGLDNQEQQALQKLMNFVGGTSPQSLLMSIKDSKDEMNSFLYEVVCAQEELFSLLKYFPDQLELSDQPNVIPKQLNEQRTEAPNKVAAKEITQNETIEIAKNINSQRELTPQILNQIDELASMMAQSNNDIKISLESGDELFYEIAEGSGLNALLEYYYPEKYKPVENEPRENTDQPGTDEAKEINHEDTIEIAKNINSQRELTPQILNQIDELASMMAQSNNDIKISLESGDELFYEIAEGSGLNALLEYYYPEKYKPMENKLGENTDQPDFEDDNFVENDDFLQNADAGDDQEQVCDQSFDIEKKSSSQDIHQEIGFKQAQHVAFFSLAKDNETSNDAYVANLPLRKN